MKKAFKNIFLPAVVLAVTLAACGGPAATTYYIDATAGSDTNNGLTPESAWQSIGKVNQATLQPGDYVLFKRGQTFQGVLEIQAQGRADAPVSVAAYGEQVEKPCIVGADSSMYAVRILNSDYITLQDLEVVNTGSERLAGRTGVKVACHDYGVSHGITLHGLTVRDVNGSLVKNEGGGCGILIESGGDSIISTFDGLTIEDCHILRCARNGIIWAADSSRQAWHPSKHTVVRGNLIEQVPGDGIVPIGCDSTLIEYNVMRDCPDLLPDTEAAAGIWPWSCDNTLIQFNEVSGHKAPWDAQGYDSDWNCTGTVIQYNYSHDNYGGMVLVCDNGEAPKEMSIGNRGTIIRYNVSIGDGIRPKPTRQGMFSPNIHIAGPVKHTRFERNIIHSNVKTVPETDRTMIVSDSWGGYADDTSFKENIFYSAEPSRFDLTESTSNHFDGNWYIGAYDNQPETGDTEKVAATYKRLILSTDPTGYKALQEELMDTYQIGGQTHHFINKEAIESFFNGFQ